MRGFLTAQRGPDDAEGAESQGRAPARVDTCESYDALVLVAALGTGGEDNGIGGVTDGSAAARRVVEIARKAIGGERPNDEAQVWAERVAGMDRILSRDRKMGEVSVVIAAVTPGRYNRVVGASVGNCGAWIIASAGVPHEAAVQNLTHRQARSPLAGSGAHLPVSFETNWPDGTLLVATSGVFERVGRNQIIDAARHDALEQAAQRLEELARQNGSGTDDIGLLLCRRETQPEAGGTSGGLLKTVSRLWNWGKK